MNDDGDRDVGSEQQPLLLIEFIAAWCPYSLVVRRVTEQIATKLKCAVRSVDIDQDPEFARECEVETVPALLLFQGTECVKRWNGQINPEDAPAWFDVPPSTHP
jgi:thioredoxin 1